MKNIGILYHPLREAAHDMAKKLAEFLKANGLSAWQCSAWDADATKAQLNGTDLLITVGGDGTILRAAQVAVHGDVPITGINLGKLGFMTELSIDETMVKLPDLLAGQGWIDERSMLEAEIPVTEGGQEQQRNYFVLNDVVMARGAIARLVNIEASIDGEPLTTYKSDGVIMATATGSTGYSLAAGGPILHPQAKEFLLVPIVPHLTMTYPMVLPASATARLHIRTYYGATLSIDGHINLSLPNGAIITVKRSVKTLQFLRAHRETTFYSSLERKLKGRQQN